MGTDRERLTMRRDSERKAGGVGVVSVVPHFDRVPIPPLYPPSGNAPYVALGPV